MYLIYQFLKIVVRVCLRVYYPFTRVLHAERLAFDYPALLVSNHPNTLLDPLVTAARTKKQVFFLANAGLFQSKFTNWFFNTFYCIPIRRQKDSGPINVSNDESFTRCFEHLEKGGVIYIAPEGGSELDRRLRPIKSGTARIALGAEARNDFQLDLHIVAVGLNYERPADCGSRMVIDVAEPIRIADWAEIYHQDPATAVRRLTQALEQRLRDHLVHTRGPEQEAVLNRLERSLQHHAPLPTAAHYERTRQLLSGLGRLQDERPTDYEQLAARTLAYRDALSAAAPITDRGLARREQSLLTPYTLIGFPIFLYGWLNHLAAFYLPQLLEKQLQLYPGYASSVKMVAGLVTFPLFYWLQFQLVDEFLPDLWAWIYLLTLPLFGYLAWRYARRTRPRWEAWRYRQWREEHPEEAAGLEERHRGLMEQVRGLV